jgi:hypothetical protein
MVVSGDVPAVCRSFLGNKLATRSYIESRNGFLISAHQVANCPLTTPPRDLSRNYRRHPDAHSDGTVAFEET